MGESTELLIGLDGGGTSTTLAVADAKGRELLRRTGPAGLVDPQCPGATAEMLVRMIREALAAVGRGTPAAALCAGLAGVDGPAERAAVRSALERSGLAGRVVVCSDGETALRGAFGPGAGLLLVSGTGSVAYGRGEDGRVERCGGWGMYVGDEGSGYAIGRMALVAALCAADGRGPETALLPALLGALELTSVRAVSARVGCAAKAEIAGLAVPALRVAGEGDAVARKVVCRAARELAAHAEALARQLGPWSGAPALVLHGGVTLDPVFRAFVLGALEALPAPPRVREAAADAVSGAVALARLTLEDDACEAAVPAPTLPSA